MQAEVHSDAELLIAQIAEEVSREDDPSAARRAYRRGFQALRRQVTLYPDAASRPSRVFESLVPTTRLLGAQCLPLGVAVTMHLYPLCALQCMPIPLLSPARFKRALLLRTIRNRSMIVANAGSERTRGNDPPLIATLAADGIRIDGTCEYMSLGSVADIVFFKANIAGDDHMVMCAADLHGDSIRVGEWKFGGRMRLADTAPITFTAHHVPRGRYVFAKEGGLKGVADYQRCWFHLFVAELYLARIRHLHETWQLPRTSEHLVNLHDAARLKELSLRLLDDVVPGADVEPLRKATGLLKLRVSMMAQSTANALRGLESAVSPRAREAAADADELGYIRLQPTADEKIVLELGASTEVATQHAKAWTGTLFRDQRSSSIAPAKRDEPCLIQHVRPLPR